MIKRIIHRIKTAIDGYYEEKRQEREFERNKIITLLKTPMTPDELANYNQSIKYESMGVRGGNEPEHTIKALILQCNSNLFSDAEYDELRHMVWENANT